jgi:hypothetical protein
MDICICDQCLRAYIRIENQDHYITIHNYDKGSDVFRHENCFECKDVAQNNLCLRCWWNSQHLYYLDESQKIRSKNCCQILNHYESTQCHYLPQKEGEMLNLNDIHRLDQFILNIKHIEPNCWLADFCRYYKQNCHNCTQRADYTMSLLDPKFEKSHFINQFGIDSYKATCRWCKKVLSFDEIREIILHRYDLMCDQCFEEVDKK